MPQDSDTLDEISNSKSEVSIQVLERVAKLMDILSKHSSPLSLKDIAQKSELHASTTHRILNDLVILRMVEKVDAGNYRLGMRLLELGNIVKSRLDVRESALELMRNLHRITHQTINLSVRQGDEIVYIERAFSERSGMQVVRAIGGRAPLHLTSTGKLFLAADDGKALQDYVKRTRLQGNNQNSITEFDTLETELKFVRSHAYAKDNEELELGVRCIAAGIYDDTHKLIAGLSISAPADRLKEEWLPDLKATALAISQAMGYPLSA